MSAVRNGRGFPARGRARPRARKNVAVVAKKMTCTIVDVPGDQRVASIGNERCSKGNLFICEDMSRRQVLICAQKMVNIQAAIWELFPCERASLASLFEASSGVLRKGKTGAWAVRKLAPTEAPSYLDEKRRHYDRTILATTNPAHWHLQAV